MVIISCPNIFTSHSGVLAYTCSFALLWSRQFRTTMACVTHTHIWAVLWRQSRVREQRSRRGRKNVKSWNGKSRRAAGTKSSWGRENLRWAERHDHGQCGTESEYSKNLQWPLWLFDQHTEFTSMIPVYCKTSRLMLLFRALKKKEKN